MDFPHFPFELETIREESDYQDVYYNPFIAELLGGESETIQGLKVAVFGKQSLSNHKFI